MPHPTLIHQRVAEANAGTNPKVIARMTSGWAVIGDSQFLKGYCLLLPDPVVADLNDFTGDQHLAFLDDMVAFGQAVLNVTNATRINYEMLGNLEPALHAHLFPRYDDEPEDLRTKPAWFYSHDVRDGAEFDLERDRPIMEAIRKQLEKMKRVR